MQDVLSYLGRNERRFIARLQEMLRIPSVSAQAQHRGDIRRCADWLVRCFRSIGLEAGLERTDGHPLVLARTRRGQGGRKPHYLIYGHYDVQPPEPFELWDSPPFEPAIRRGRIFARGSSDNKGQHLAHLNAVEAYLRTEARSFRATHLPHRRGGGGRQRRHLPVPGEAPPRAALRRGIVSDTGMPGARKPALTYGLRGIAGARSHAPRPRAGPPFGGVRRGGRQIRRSSSASS